MMGAMDHGEVLELLHDAAVEPGGLERLMAGDTSAASALAGHLAGCPSCTAELERLRRAVEVIRPVVAASPPPELREATLAYVAALGRPRSPISSVGAGLGALDRPRPASGAGVRRLPPLRTLAALAAVLIVAVTGTGLAVTANRDAVLRDQAAEIDALGDVARWTLRVDAEADARRATLASDTGAGTTGTVVFSPTSTEVVVVADALARPVAGQEYRCWVEVGGVRRPIGKMFFGGSLAYWVGPVPEIKDLPAGARFGVSLVDVGGPAASGQPVLEGVG
jgi:hypothetical protein